MQDENIENKVKKEIADSLKRIEELGNSQFQIINEILAHRRLVAYYLFLFERQKSPRKGDFFGFLD